jgi:hypothetical protein
MVFAHGSPEWTHVRGGLALMVSLALPFVTTGSGQEREDDNKETDDAHRQARDEHPWVVLQQAHQIDHDTSGSDRGRNEDCIAVRPH